MVAEEVAAGSGGGGMVAAAAIVAVSEATISISMCILHSNFNVILALGAKWP
jgi:hypothetical protein